MTRTKSRVKHGATIKWHSHGSVELTLSGRKEDIGKEFTFGNDDGPEYRCSSRLLTGAELEGGDVARVTYRDHGRGTEQRVVVGGPPPSRRRRRPGTSESDDDDDSAYSSDSQRSQERHTPRCRCRDCHDDEGYDSDHRSSQPSDQESTSSDSNRRGRRRRQRPSRHRRSPEPRRNSAPRRYTYYESDSDESSRSSPVIQPEAPAIVNRHAEGRDIMYDQALADNCPPQALDEWVSRNQDLMPSVRYWEKSITDYLANPQCSNKISVNSKFHTACTLALKQAGGASFDNLQAFTDAALTTHGIRHRDPVAWKHHFATLVLQSTANDYPLSKYDAWLALAADDVTREKQNREATNWADLIVSELPQTFLNNKDTATRDKKIERIVNTATQLTDQRRTDRSASKLTAIVNKFIRDGGGTDELRRADMKDMRRSIESLNRRKKSTLAEPLYPALDTLVETAFTKLQSEQGRRSRRTRTRTSRPHDEDTDRRQVRFIRTHSEPSRRRSSNGTPRQRNSAGRSHTRRSTHDSRRRASEHRSRRRRDERRDYEEFSDDDSSGCSSTGSGHESRGRTAVEFFRDGWSNIRGRFSSRSRS